MEQIKLFTFSRYLLDIWREVKDKRNGYQFIVDHSETTRVLRGSYV